MSHAINTLSKANKKFSSIASLPTKPLEKGADVLGIGGTYKKIAPFAGNLVDPTATTTISKIASLANKGSLGKVSDVVSKDVPQPLSVNLDDATQGAFQQQDLMRRRRGVLANIFAGMSASAPTVSTKSLLGA